MPGHQPEGRTTLHSGLWASTQSVGPRSAGRTEVCGGPEARGDDLPAAHRTHHDWFTEGSY